MCIRDSAYTVMSYPKKESFFESLMNTNPGNYIKARMLKGTMGEIYQPVSYTHLDVYKRQV